METPIEVRDMLDKLIRKYGFEKVEITIESILDFYRQEKPKVDNGGFSTGGVDIF